MADITEIAIRYADRLEKRKARAVKSRSLANSFDNLLLTSLSAIQISFLSEFNDTLVDLSIDTLDKLYTVIMEDKIELDKLTDAETRKLLVRHEDIIPLGGIFLAIDEYWLIARNESLTNEVYKRYQIKKCNYSLKWIDKYGFKHDQKCIAYDYTLYSDGLNEKVGITTGNSKVGILIPINNDTMNLRRDDRFLIGGVAYKLSKQDNYTGTGVKTVVMREIETSSLDDIENGYAYNYKQYTYTLKFDISDTELALGDNTQIKPLVTKNGDVDDAQLVWRSSDISKATVDEHGLITGINAGTVTITSSLKYNLDIEDSFILNVKPFIVTNTTYEIVGQEFIKYGRTEEYEVKQFVNGVENESYIDNVIFVLNDISSVILTNNSDNTCTIKTNTYNKSIELSTIIDGNTYTKNIQLKSLL